MGIAFVSIVALISFYIDKVDRKKLLSRQSLSNSTDLSTFVSILTPSSSFFRSLLVGGVCGIRFFNINYSPLLCDGCMLYDIFELWTLRWYHQCYIGCPISNKYQVRSRSSLALLDDNLINA